MTSKAEWRCRATALLGEVDLQRERIRAISSGQWKVRAMEAESLVADLVEAAGAASFEDRFPDLANRVAAFRAGSLSSEQSYTSRR